MGVTVLDNGEDLQTAAFGGRLSTNVINYLNNQIQQYAPYIKDNTFLADSVKKLTTFTSESVQRAREALANMFDYNKTNDRIHFIDSLTGIQQAPGIMQRYIMAHDTLRPMFLNGNLDGYAGSYENVRGNAVGEDLYEWRRVHSGIISLTPQEDAEGNTFTGWTSTTYYDVIEEGDQNLRFDQQCDILDTYRVIDKLLEEQDSDPTSRLNNSL